MMTSPKRHALAILVTTLLAVVITYLTLTPMRLEPPERLLSDKAYHLLAFAALIFPCALVYRRSLIFVVPAALVFGAAIELIQPLVGRSAEWADFLADVIGVALGLITSQMVRVLISKSAAGQRLRSRRARASR